MLYTSSEISKIFNCNFSYDVSGVTIDSRFVKKGNLFFAIKGQNCNGHAFVADVLNAGGYAVIDDVEFLKSCTNFSCECFERDKLNKSRNCDSGGNDKNCNNVCDKNCSNYNYDNCNDFNKIIIVDNVLDALKRLALYARMKCEKSVIAITGNAGKTTTKNLLKFALTMQDNDVFATSGNLNNQIGCPLTLANLPKNCSGIIEIGTNNYGEVANLAELVRPNIAIITNVGSAHIGNFSSQFDVAKEKSEIFCCNNTTPFEKKLAIINQTSSYFRFWKATAKEYAQVLTFGQISNQMLNVHSFNIDKNNNNTANFFPDVFVSSVEKDDCIKITYSVLGKKYTVSTTIANYAIYDNVCVVLALCCYLKLDIEKILNSIFQNFSQIAGRGNIYKFCNDNIIIIDDTYNASLESIRNGIASLQLYPDDYKKIVVLGDMKEVGKLSKEIHEKIIPMIGKYAISKAFLCGDEMKNVYDQIRCEKYFATDSAFLYDQILQNIFCGGLEKCEFGKDEFSACGKTEFEGGLEKCILYIKGAHSMEMNLIVEKLVEKLS